MPHLHVAVGVEIDLAGDELAAGVVPDRDEESRRVERGVLNWGWVQGLFSVIDQHVPGGSATSFALER